MTQPSGSLLSVVVSFLLLVVSPAGVRAQTSGWAVDVAAGRAVHDPVSTSIGTNNLSLGLRYGGPLGWLYVSGGTPISSEGVNWGAAGLGRRITAGQGMLSAGIDLGAHGYGFSDTEGVVSGSGATLEALPLLLVQRGSVLAEIRSGVLQYRSRAADTSLTRTGHDSGIRLTLAHEALTVQGEGRLLRVSEGDFPYAGGAAQFVYGRATTWGSIGRWLDDALPTLALGAGASMRVTDHVDVHASWQQEPNDPLYWNSPQRTWSIRLSRSFGTAPLPAPVLPRAEDGRITIRIPVDASPSAAPSVLGDFTGWEPVPMVRSGEFWTVNLPVEQGTHYYGFKHADGTWFVPSSLPNQVDDGMGGRSAVLVVP
jgi:hypothetical protein